MFKLIICVVLMIHVSVFSQKDTSLRNYSNNRLLIQCSPGLIYNAIGLNYSRTVSVKNNKYQGFSIGINGFGAFDFFGFLDSSSGPCLDMNYMLYYKRKPEKFIEFDFGCIALLQTNSSSKGLTLNYLPNYNNRYNIIPTFFIGQRYESESGNFAGKIGIGYPSILQFGLGWKWKN